MTITIKNGIAIIDDVDSVLVSGYNWYVDNSGYVIAWLPRSKSFLRMHNFILGYNGELDIDHINQIKHDNRRGNLRIVEHWKNLHNTKLRTDNTNGYKGVFQGNTGFSWGWQVWIKGRKHTKQGFTSPQEAAKARELFLREKL